MHVPVGDFAVTCGTPFADPKNISKCFGDPLIVTFDVPFNPVRNDDFVVVLDHSKFSHPL